VHRAGLPESDRRPVRAVVRYEDRPSDRDLFHGNFAARTVAIDVLACGHKVVCARLAGGKLRPHDEPCDECAQVQA